MNKLPDDFDPDELDQELADADVDVDDELEEEPAATVGGPAPRFDYNQRLYALAMSRSGKSELLNVIFSGVTCQKVLLDTKPEFAIEGVTPAHTPESIDWTEPIIHYQPEPGSDYTQYEPIFEMLLTTPGPVTVCVHELQDLVDYQPQRAGRFLRGYFAKGGALGKGALAGTQRPRLAPTGVFTEATHVVMLPPQLARREDLVTAAETISPVNGEIFDASDLAAELSALPQYGFLWKDRTTGVLHAFPPLPEEIRRLSIVHRTIDN